MELPGSAGEIGGMPLLIICVSLDKRHRLYTTFTAHVICTTIAGVMGQYGCATVIARTTGRPFEWRFRSYIPRATGAMLFFRHARETGAGAPTEAVKRAQIRSLKRPEMTAFLIVLGKPNS